MGLASLHVVLAKEPNVVRAKGPDVVLQMKPDVLLEKDQMVSSRWTQILSLQRKRRRNPVLVKGTRRVLAGNLARFSRDVGCRGTTPATFRIYEQGTSRLAYPNLAKNERDVPAGRNPKWSFFSEYDSSVYYARLTAAISCDCDASLRSPATGGTGYRFHRHLGQPYLGNHRRQDQRSRGEVRVYHYLEDH